MVNFGSLKRTLVVYIETCTPSPSPLLAVQSGPVRSGPARSCKTKFRINRIGQLLKFYKHIFLAPWHNMKNLEPT